MKNGWTFIACGLVLGYWSRYSSVMLLFFGIVPIFIGILLVTRLKKVQHEISVACPSTHSQDAVTAKEKET